MSSRSDRGAPRKSSERVRTHRGSSRSPRRERKAPQNAPTPKCGSLRKYNLDVFSASRALEIIGLRVLGALGFNILDRLDADRRDTRQAITPTFSAELTFELDVLNNPTLKFPIAFCPARRGRTSKETRHAAQAQRSSHARLTGHRYVSVPTLNSLRRDRGSVMHRRCLFPRGTVGSCERRARDAMSR